MVKKNDIIPKDKNIIPVLLEEAMPDNYLPYAVEVAKERALPDVRDGLKPVHRRILYGAYLLKAFPERPYYKSARIVGDILGKFHPHGDTSVYDATVILAQNFTTREPLIDGHGNFGSIDGDGAAAMRYTEARLTEIAMEMLKDIEKDTVDMVPNYSDSELEPKVLPSRYPNLLVNGVFGIAVGLATNIPPHNLGEVIQGVLEYIDNPTITVKELMKYIKGPDLPTGGILIGSNSLVAAYETGEGKVICRAKTSIEKLDNGRVGIVISEFPYKRNKSKLLQNISDMTADKKHAKALENICDIRDESDRSGIRAVIEFKKSVDENVAEKVLKYLFKKTDLQCNISFNMVALANGKPETMGLKTIIMHYVNHQKDVVTRRTKRDLEIAKKRFHIVEGFIKAINIIDKVIATIRKSKSKKEACSNIMDEYKFTEIQANAILELMLYRLTGLEISVFQKEYDELKARILELKEILEDDRKLLKVIKSELIEITKKYKNPRRTKIIKNEELAKIDTEELIVVEDIVLTVSNEGFVKRIPEKSYIRSTGKPEDIEYREEDYLRWTLKSNTKDSILFFTNRGTMYQTKGINFPECKWKEKGERVDNVIKTLSLDNEKIVSVISVSEFLKSKYLRIISAKGSIKKSSLDKFKTNYSKIQVTKLKDFDEIIDVSVYDKSENFIKINTKIGLEFIAQIPKLDDMQRTAVGIQFINLPSTDKIKKIENSNKEENKKFIIGINSKGVIKIFNNRNKKDKFKVLTNSKSNLLIFTSEGRVIKINSFLLENIKEKELKISELVEGYDSKEKIVSIFSLEVFEKEQSICIITKNGIIKRMLLSELVGDYFVMKCHKFKRDGDEIIGVLLNNDKEKNILIISKKGMAIKFEASSVNLMGKLASGVTAISLKENDETIYCDLVDENEKPNFKIITKLKEKIEINLDKLKLQNRAGRGRSIMLDKFEDVIINIKRSE